eukprot:5497539-Prymnesium_polylepis.2
MVPCAVEFVGSILVAALEQVVPRCRQPSSSTGGHDNAPVTHRQPAACEGTPLTGWSCAHRRPAAGEGTPLRDRSCVMLCASRHGGRRVA